MSLRVAREGGEGRGVKKNSHIIKYKYKKETSLQTNRRKYLAWTDIKHTIASPLKHTSTHFRTFMAIDDSRLNHSSIFGLGGRPKPPKCEEFNLRRPSLKLRGVSFPKGRFAALVAAAVAAEALNQAHPCLHVPR